MSTREMAYNMIAHLTEEQVQELVAYISSNYMTESNAVSEKQAAFQTIGTIVDDMEERRAAFERMEKLRRPMRDIDEKKELAEYREEKYGK